MHHRTRLTHRNVMVVTGLILGAALASPRVAASQARGSLQATAMVVDTRVSSQALATASQAANRWATDRGTVTNDVSTVSQVRVAYRNAEVIVVEIDYLKN
jgi:hypothetical protein